MKKVRKAFSLVEVLIAMVIVTLITTTGMFAYRLAIKQVERQKSLTYDVAIRYTQLKNLFSGTYFYIVEERNKFNPNTFEYKYLFKKGDFEILFVSQSPLYSDVLSLISLRLDDGNLYYKEVPIYGEKQNYKEPVFLEDTKEYLILNNLEEAKFSFEGAYNLPKDLESRIPKLVILEFKQEGIGLKYIFDIKYDFYKLKKYLENKRVVI